MQIKTSTLPIRHRPHRLEDVVGQESVVELIQESVDAGEFSSAYLFEGGTGQGKTTLARILASYMSCAKGTICGKCPACKAGIANPDITHKDAATEGKVDDIRALCKVAYVSPMYGKRVIIIDECHMLTGAAANALLITLEEPPRDTVFILCTTEPEKLLRTIRDRCTRMVLQPVPAPLMIKRMLRVIKQEKKGKIDKELIKPGLKTIADLADGSMRSALSLLETVINSDMKQETIEKRFRAANKSLADIYVAAADVVAAVLGGDIPSAVKAIRSCEQRSIIYELTNLLDNVIGKMCGYSDSNTYGMRLLRDRIKSQKLEVDVRILSLYLAAVSGIKYENLYKTTLQNTTVVFIDEQSSN